MIMMNKINKPLAACLVGCAFGVAMVSCTDFTDYNEAPVDELAQGNQTLWENILKTDELTDFAALVKRTGFDVELSNTRSYTVWAPVNGSFNPSDYESLNDSMLLQQFVKSHVAEYTHVATGEVDKRIHALNEKSFTFTGNGSYTYDELPISKANLPGSNGMLHLLNGVAQFFPNLYEYLRMGEDIKLLSDEFLRYETSELDKKNSVKGPVVDGVQTYSYKAYVTSNSLVNRLGARLSNEDSTYTFLMPNDKAYQEYYDRVKPYYNFITKTIVQDIDNYTKGEDNKTKTADLAQWGWTATYLTDSLVRRLATHDLVYSNNDTYNRWLVEKGEYTDTLRTTTRSKFSNPMEILEPVVEKVNMSNGMAYIMDSLAFLPWEAYNPEVYVNPASHYYSPIDVNNKNKNRFDFSANRVSVPDSIARKMFGPEASGFRYLWAKSTNEFAPPHVYISLPDILSTTYKVYAVYLPGRFQIGEDRYYKFGADEKPNILYFQLNYCDAKGKAAVWNFNAADTEQKTSPTKLKRSMAFVNDPTKVDTVYLGNITFPVAYKGLGDEYTPNIHIYSPYDGFDDDDVATYSQDVRIMAIILKPMELAEFEEKQK